MNILDCYLKKNLVTRGGYLDEVRFMINTKKEDDIKWVDELLKTEPLYRKVETLEKGGHYDNLWNNHATEDNTMYIKIDDDVVSLGSTHKLTILRLSLAPGFRS